MPAAKSTESGQQKWNKTCIEEKKEQRKMMHEEKLIFLLFCLINLSLKRKKINSENKKRKLFFFVYMFRDHISILLSSKKRKIEIPVEKQIWKNFELLWPSSWRRCRPVVRYSGGKVFRIEKKQYIIRRKEIEKKETTKIEFAKNRHFGKLKKNIIKKNKTKRKM